MGRFPCILCIASVLLDSMTRRKWRHQYHSRPDAHPAFGGLPVRACVRACVCVCVCVCVRCKSLYVVCPRVLVCRTLHCSGIACVIVSCMYDKLFVDLFARRVHHWLSSFFPRPCLLLGCDVDISVGTSCPKLGSWSLSSWQLAGVLPHGLDLMMLSTVFVCLFVWLNGGVNLFVSDLLWWFELTTPAFVLIFTRMYWRAFFRVCDNCESWVTIESWVTTVCHGWQVTFVGDNCPSWATTAIASRILSLLHLLSSVFFFSTFLKACSIWLNQFVFILLCF